MEPLSEPHLGIFWFAGPLASGRDEVASPQLIASSTPASKVPLIGGFKTTDPGHVDIWPSLQRKHGFLRGYPYEFFPRGRVNYLADTDRYLVLLDPELLRPPFVQLVEERFFLPPSRDVMTDSHYRTRVRCGVPTGTLS